MPEPRVNQDARAYSAELIGALGEANQKILDGAAFMKDTRDRNK